MPQINLDPPRKSISPVNQQRRLLSSSGVVAKNELFVSSLKESEQQKMLLNFSFAVECYELSIL